MPGSIQLPAPGTVPRSSFGYPPIYSSLDISGVRDVDLVGLEDLFGLVYDEERLLWQASKVGGNNELTEMSDTQIASPAVHQILTYNGTKWVNASWELEFNDLSDVALNEILDDDFMYYNGSEWVGYTWSQTFANLSNVMVGTQTNNDVLIYNGAAWVDRSSITLDSVTGTVLTATNDIIQDSATLSGGVMTGVVDVDIEDTLNAGAAATLTGSLAVREITDGVTTIKEGAVTGVDQISLKVCRLNKGYATVNLSQAPPFTLNASAGVVTFTLDADLYANKSILVYNDHCEEDSVIIAWIQGYTGDTTLPEVGAPAVYVNNIADEEFELVIYEIDNFSGGTTSLSGEIVVSFAIH